MKEELRHWATVISIALAVTSVAIKYAHVEFQIKQFEKEVVIAKKQMADSRKDIEFLRASLLVEQEQQKRLVESINRLHSRQSEKYEDE